MDQAGPSGPTWILSGRHLSTRQVRVLSSRPQCGLTGDLSSARQLPELVQDASGGWGPMRSTGMRRNLRAVLAGSLLFAGLTAVSSAAASALGEGAASAKGSCSPVDSRLISGLEGPYAIAVSGPDLFVTNTVYPGT